MPSNGPNLISPNAKNKTEITFESLKEDLDCPVCYDVPESLPIYQCTQGHIICNSCYPKLNNCPVCRVNLKSKIRALIAEKILQKHRDVPYNQSMTSDQGQGWSIWSTRWPGRPAGERARAAQRTVRQVYLPQVRVCGPPQLHAPWGDLLYSASQRVFRARTRAFR